MGKDSTGSVVNHRRKSGCGLLTFSSCFSTSLMKESRRWQFWNINHCPRDIAVSSRLRAMGSCPWPRERYLNFPPPKPQLKIFLMFTVSSFRKI